MEFNAMDLEDLFRVAAHATQKAKTPGAAKDVLGKLAATPPALAAIGADLKTVPQDKAGIRKNRRPVTTAGSPMLWLTTEDAAALLGLAPSTLNMYRREGRGPVYCQVGGPGGQHRIFYTMSDLQAYIDKHKVTPSKASRVKRTKFTLREAMERM